MRANPQTSVVAVERLELVEAAAVDDARDHLADVVADRGSPRARSRRGRPGRRAAPPAASALPGRAPAGGGSGSRRSRGRSRARARRRRRSGRRRRRCGSGRPRRRAPPPSPPRRSPPSRAAGRRGRSSRCPCTITVSSLIAGTYAPPAVHEPMTSATCGMPRRPTSAPGCRRCGRSAPGRGRPRPAAAGTRRPSRRGRCTGGGSARATSCARRCFFTVSG